MVLLFEIEDDRIMILIVGLDTAGKATILKRGKVVAMIPISGFNVDSVEYKNISFTVWDVRGHYYQNTKVIIFVVDSNESDKIDRSSGGDTSAKEI